MFYLCNGFKVWKFVCVLNFYGWRISVRVIFRFLILVSERYFYEVESGGEVIGSRKFRIIVVVFYGFWGFYLELFVWLRLGLFVVIFL